MAVSSAKTHVLFLFNLIKKERSKRWNVFNFIQGKPFRERSHARAQAATPLGPRRETSIRRHGLRWCRPHLHRDPHALRPRRRRAAPKTCDYLGASRAPPACLAFAAVAVPAARLTRQTLAHRSSPRAAHSGDRLAASRCTVIRGVRELRRKGCWCSSPLGLPGRRHRHREDRGAAESAEMIGFKSLVLGPSLRMLASGGWPAWRAGVLTRSRRARAPSLAPALQESSACRAGGARTTLRNVSAYRTYSRVWSQKALCTGVPSGSVSVL